MKSTPLKAARIKKGIEVEEISQRLQISSSYYYKIERGVRKPNIYLAKRIAELLDGTVDEIFFGRDLDVLSNELSLTGTDNT